MARRLGTAGYYVMLPNPYYRHAREFRMKMSSRENMFEHMHSLTNKMVCEDIQVPLDFAAFDDAAEMAEVVASGTV